MIKYEKEIINFLNIPSIPKKEFDGKTSFSKGVAVVELEDDREAYAVCSFNTDRGDKEPRVTKTFGLEHFFKIKKVFVVPNYMSRIEDVKDMDLDDNSKKKAIEILNEAKEREEEGSNTKDPMEELPEWVFPEINSKEQAIAWLKSYNSRNRIKGKVPVTEENIKLRLYSIYSQEKEHNKL
jgi:hypothetical protein